MRFILLLTSAIVLSACATGNQTAMNGMGGAQATDSTYERNLDKPWQFRRPPGSDNGAWGGFGKDVQVGY